MVRERVSIAVAVWVAALHLTSCGSGVGNAGPRISTVPGQVASGGQAFSLDLSDYVTDREGNFLVYTVDSGGGTFTRSTYHNTFDTIGSYSVDFTVSDTEGKTSSGSFDVVVHTANLAVIDAGDELKLVDTDTQAFLTVASSGGFTDTVVATFADGKVAYQRQRGTVELRVYDPAERSTATLGASASYDTRYVTATSDGKIVFTRTSTASPTDSDLYLWVPETGVIRAISAHEGEVEGNAMVNADDLVFYQRGTPTDVYYYDPDEDESTAVATASTAEVLRGTVAGGGVVYSRIGGGGEQDLFYYAVAAGESEIGADLSSTIQSQTKTFRGSTTDDRVVFEVTGASDIDLYIWNPGNGQSRAIATSGVDETFAAVSALDEVVYVVATGVGDDDLAIYTPSDDSSRTISPADGVNDVYQGLLSTGDVVLLRETGTGDDLYVYSTSGSSLAALASASASDYSLDKILANDKVVYTLAGGSGGVFVVNTTGAPSPTQVGAAGSSFAGETSGGDFVVATVVSSQDDLVLWDESGSTVVTISDTTGDDAFGAGTAAGDVLFTRVESGKTTADLFLWDAGTATEAQLTDTEVDHSVVTTFAADDS